MNPHEGPAAFDDIARTYVASLAPGAGGEVRFTIPVTEEVLRDFGRWPRYLDPDRNPFPRIDAFPRAARLTRRARARYNAARYRFAEIVEVARHGLPEDDEW